MSKPGASAKGIGRRPTPAAAARPRFGSTRRWRRLRAIVLARDGHRCALCGNYGNDVGHIRARALGGQDVPTNLRVECASCNRSAGAKLGIQLRRKDYPGAIELD